MKTLKLTGNFDRSRTLCDAMAEVEAAQSAVDEIVASGAHGSEEYHEALKALKAAKAGHAVILKDRQ